MGVERSKEPRRYWSERQGRGPKAEPLTVERLRTLIFNAFDGLQEQGYFQEAFGYHCVDEGQVSGALGRDPNAFFLKKLHRDDLWPYRKCEANYDIDTLYDVIELLYDIVSQPVQGRYHDFSNCGYHYHKFDHRSGQIEYRDDLNEILMLADPAAKLQANGNITLFQPEGYDQLLADAVPTNAPDEVESRINAAVRDFQEARTNDDLRHAVRDLLDALELIRADVKEHLLSSHERDLFMIANNFGIRHLNQRQQLDYEKAPWLRWIFYTNLATLHLVLRLRERA